MNESNKKSNNDSEWIKDIPKNKTPINVLFSESTHNKQLSCCLQKKIYTCEELLFVENKNVIEDIQISIYDVLSAIYPFLDKNCTELLFDIYYINDIYNIDIEKFIMQFSFLNKNDMKNKILQFVYYALSDRQIVPEKIEKNIDYIKRYYGIDYEKQSYSDISRTYNVGVTSVSDNIKRTMRHLCRRNKSTARRYLFYTNTIIDIYINKKDFYQRGILFRKNIDSIEKLYEYKSRLCGDERNEIEQMILDIVRYEQNVLKTISDNIHTLSERFEITKVKQEIEKSENEIIRKMDLSILNISNKAYVKIIKLGYHTIGEVYDLFLNYNDVKSLRGVGEAAINEIAHTLDILFKTNRFKSVYCYSDKPYGVYNEYISSENERELKKENKKLTDKISKYEKQIDRLNKENTLLINNRKIQNSIIHDLYGIVDQHKYAKNIYDRLELVEILDDNTAILKLKLEDGEEIVMN